jgi:hypothetical protein
MAVRRLAAGFEVVALRHVELESLVEVVKRVRHPIFMDATFCLFPEKSRIHEALLSILDDSAFQTPVVGLIAPDKIQPFEAPGLASTAATQDRRRALLKQALPINPYEYPSALFLQEREVPGGGALSRVTRMRLADLLQNNQAMNPPHPRFSGFVSALAAAEAVAELLPSEEAGGAVRLCDVGKLRTLYLNAEGEKPPQLFAIPVGLARDDMHYFKNLPIEIAKLEALRSHFGPILLPSDVTPAPAFNGGSTLQLDSTRLAVQVSRYASRAFPRLLEGPEPVHYLTGRGSRLPGMRDFLEKRLGEPIRRLDRRPLDDVALAPGIRWADVADHILLLGGAMEVLRPTPRSVGIVPTDYRIPPVRSNRCSIADLSLDTAYIFEQPCEVS